MSKHGKNSAESKERQAERVARDWSGNAYYADAEQWAFVFWIEDGVFRPFFERLNLEHIVELACGHGRHAEMFKDRAQKITLLDILAENVNQCRSRFAGQSHIVCMRNNGTDFKPLGDASATSIFCYDAMVHFTPDVVESYLIDAYRVLADGGRALFHHSNYGVRSEHHYGQNPHARNYMTQELFFDFADKAGLAVEESRIISWGYVPDLDCITLLRKPSRR
jgi:SAM-dependent methyltransferase